MTLFIIIAIQASKDVTTVNVVLNNDARQIMAPQASLIDT